MKAIVLTVSDRVSAGEATDVSGPTAARLLEKYGFTTSVGRYRTVSNRLPASCGLPSRKAPAGGHHRRYRVRPTRRNSGGDQDGYRPARSRSCRGDAVGNVWIEPARHAVAALKPASVSRL